jgi:hypothetical protein
MHGNQYTLRTVVPRVIEDPQSAEENTWTQGRWSNMRRLHNILVRKSQGKLPLGRPGRRWDVSVGSQGPCTSSFFLFGFNCMGRDCALLIESGYCLHTIHLSLTKCSVRDLAGAVNISHRQCLQLMNFISSPGSKCSETKAKMRRCAKEWLLEINRFP